MEFGSIFGNTAAYLFSPVTIAYALAATGLAVHFGYAGLLNFGMAAFMAAVRAGGPAPIPLEEIVEVSRTTLRAAQG